MYEFREQLKKEETERLDRHFSERFAIEPASMREQRLGIDRIFVNKEGCRYSVEYKADHKGCETGNAFIETISQDTRNVLGWALTCCAQIHVHFFPALDIVLWGETIQIRKVIFKWMEKYPWRDVPNKDQNGEFIYNTRGLLVPRAELKKRGFKSETVLRTVA